ncbi:MAG: hypothetical protein J2P43_16420 [Candidatus Dormibacteraeota bacterium]|nr:hypothetical protein [Candidatus Dormibacteraeota bacterium]
MVEGAVRVGTLDDARALLEALEETARRTPAALVQIASASARAALVNSQIISLARAIRPSPERSPGPARRLTG